MDGNEDREIPEHQSYTFKDKLVYLVFRLFIAILQSMSIERCQRLCSVLATLLTHHVKIRRRLVEENLQLVFPQWPPNESRDVQQKMWEHLLLMVCEIAHAPRKIHRENWHEYFLIANRKPILQVTLDQRPKVLVSGHFGNFELAGFVTGLFGISTTTIARPLDNGFIHDFVNRFRSLGGQHLLPKTGSALAIETLLENGGGLALLADQYGGPKGCWVDFLGHPASCHKALALFTLSSGAPMLVCSNVRTKKPLQFELKALGIADPKDPQCPDSIQSLTKWYNQCLEGAIRETPQQYWWVHRRWRGEPPKRARSSATQTAAA